MLIISGEYFILTVQINRGDDSLLYKVTVTVTKEITKEEAVKQILAIIKK